MKSCMKLISNTARRFDQVDLQLRAHLDLFSPNPWWLFSSTL